MKSFIKKVLVGLMVWLFLLPGMAVAARIVGVSLCQKVQEPGTIPLSITEKFPATAPNIHAVVVVDKVQPGTRFRGTWVAVDAIDTPNYEIDSATVQVDGKDARLHFSISKPTSGWPPGNYKLDIYIDDTFFTSTPFSIASAPAAANPFQQDRPAAQAPPPRKSAEGGPASRLLGKWVCYSEAGNMSLVFESSNRLVFDGEAASYTLVPGALRVQEDYGAVDYPYSLQGDQLVITFPEGYRLQFTRAGAGGSRPSAQNNQMAPQAGSGFPAGRPGMQGQTGQEYQLQGRLCRWSGSSSSYGGTSYSSSGWAFFDGQGHFSYGSESSFSGDAGMAYSQNQNSGNRGTYSVQGNQVYLTFSDGSRSVASVHMRQNSGAITELMYDGSLYATGLCE